MKLLLNNYYLKVCQNDNVKCANFCENIILFSKEIKANSYRTSKKFHALAYAIINCSAMRKYYL